MSAKEAAELRGWTRIFPSGYFNAQLDNKNKICDYESWEELCDSEGIEYDYVSEKSYLF